MSIVDSVHDNRFMSPGSSVKLSVTMLIETGGSIRSRGIEQVSELRDYVETRRFGRFSKAL